MHAVPLPIPWIASARWSGDRNKMRKARIKTQESNKSPKFLLVRRMDEVLLPRSTHARARVSAKKMLREEKSAAERTEIKLKERNKQRRRQKRGKGGKQADLDASHFVMTRFATALGNKIISFDWHALNRDGNSARSVQCSSFVTHSTSLWCIYIN